MNEEFERTWEEAIVDKSTHYPGICLKPLMKPTENLSQSGRCPLRNPSVAPAKHYIRELYLYQAVRRLVFMRYSIRITTGIAVIVSEVFIFPLIVGHDPWMGRSLPLAHILIFFLPFPYLQPHFSA
jgi:hypothetical protein